MSTQATVRLWGTEIGYVTLANDREIADFEYDRDFLRSGIKLSPLGMPLARNLSVHRACHKILPWIAGPFGGFTAG